MKNKLLKWPVPAYAHLPLILCFVTMMLSYYLPRLIGVAPRFDFSFPLDARIPLVSWFSYIYILAYVHWALSYIYVSTFSEAFTRRLFLADLIGKIAALICFLIFPLEIARPALEEIGGAGAWLTRIIYKMDEPNNLFPSLHCFVSYLCVRPLLAKGAPKGRLALKLAIAVFSLLVCLSTLFTRQHLLADVFSGIALGEIAWHLSGAVMKRLPSRKPHAR